jgi:hypothetical protein
VRAAAAAAAVVSTHAGRARYRRAVQRHGWRDQGGREFAVLAAWQLTQVLGS